MESSTAKKFSLEEQNEIEDILKYSDAWNSIFYINYEFFFDGWAIFLKEKAMYPREIIIFKSYNNNEYSIKSFEVSLNELKNEEFTELYSKKKICIKEDLLIELKEIIYGKDLH